VTCIGIDIVDGVRLRAHSAKAVLVLLAITELISRRRASPKCVEILLGSVQHFYLLNRPLFSTLDSLYAFAREGLPGSQDQSSTFDERAELTLSDVLLGELALIVCLAPFWQADLRRPWLPEITATDASQDFGFGISVASCTVNMARRIGRLGEKRGDFVRLDRGDIDDEPERDRIGKPHRLGLRKSAFSTVLSVRHLHKAHAGSLEATGLQLLLRWLLRSRRRQGRRVVALVDAKAILCAAAKGRTSACSIKRDIRRISALTLAGNLHMHYVYVPSEDNPADAPSRGVIRKVTKRKRGALRRCREPGPRPSKEDTLRARDACDPIQSHLAHVTEVAAHTGDRGLVAQWEHALRTWA
jgi:hypothetical protein